MREVVEQINHSACIGSMGKKGRNALAPTTMNMSLRDYERKPDRTPK
ncbi:MAG: hypothetical protein WC647_19930 [Desulfomonilaceae bacterium]